MSVDLTPFPANQARIFRAILDRLDVVETIAKRNPAVPITQATGSGGFLFPNGPTPAASPNGAVGYAVSGGQFRVVYSDGSVHQMLDTAAAVASPPVFTSPSSPASVTVGVYQALRDDSQAVRGSLIGLLVALRAKGHILP